MIVILLLTVVVAIICLCVVKEKYKLALGFIIALHLTLLFMQLDGVIDDGSNVNLLELFD